VNLGGRIASRGSHCSLLVRAAGLRSARLSYLSFVAFVVMSAVDIAAKAVFTASSASETHGIAAGQIIVCSSIRRQGDSQMFELKLMSEDASAAEATAIATVAVARLLQSEPTTVVRQEAERASSKVSSVIVVSNRQIARFHSGWATLRSAFQDARLIESASEKTRPEKTRRRKKKNCVKCIGGHPRVGDG